MFLPPQRTCRYSPYLGPYHCWFMVLFSNVFMQLICLLPFFCQISPCETLFSRQLHTAECLTAPEYLTEHTVSGWFIFCMISVNFIFCVEWDHSCNFASHACPLVAFLPDPLNAPLCSYVDMAPSAVGLWPFWVSSEVRKIIASANLSKVLQKTTKINTFYMILFGHDVQQ